MILKTGKIWQKKTGEDSKKNMDEDDKDVIFRSDSIEAVTDYEQDNQFVEKKVKENKDAATVTVTVSTATDVAATTSNKED